MLEQLGAMQKHGEKKQIEVVHCLAKPKIARAAGIDDLQVCWIDPFADKVSAQLPPLRFPQQVK